MQQFGTDVWVHWSSCSLHESSVQVFWSLQLIGVPGVHWALLHDSWPLQYRLSLHSVESVLAILHWASWQEKSSLIMLEPEQYLVS